MCTSPGQLSIVGLVLLVSAASGPNPCLALTESVDPFIGTGGHGHTYPGASVPFGMVQLSPDTRLTGWDGCSGYHYTDSVVYGFSHTHLSGTGVSDYGDILFMPVTGVALLDNGYQRDPDSGYGSRFEKSTEQAGAGWYEVTLADYGVRVELTAGERIGMHRYAFPTGDPAHVIVDLTHRDHVLESWLRIVSPTEIQGMRRSSAWARDQVVYFHARFSQPFAATVHAGAQSGQTYSGQSVKAVLSFGEAGATVEVAVGISAVDAAGAQNNLESELGQGDFDAVKTRATAAWDTQLSKFEIEGATPTQRTVFATALYHSFLAPNLFSDADGRYRGMDQQVHQTQGRRHYTVFSLWDTYRATHPLFTIVERERTAEFIETFLAQYQQGGRLPVWELAANETECMIGYHSVSVIADAYVKGIDGFDADLALEAMQHSATLDHFGLQAYQRDGFIAADEESESVSKTLEYAYDDWTIARMAEAMGRPEVMQRYDRRSQAWRHLLDPATGFLRPRENGGWLEPYDPRRVDFHHTEANGWQYRFMVPHDIESLIEGFGGDARFLAALDSLFEIDSATTGRDQPDITGRIGQYAHGNEPSHHVAWLYHFAGRPDRSAARVRTILDEFYTTEPDGLIGNEDCGQMSSWYVFGAMGLYPVAPGSQQYVLTPPLFARTALHLENGATFAIEARGPREGQVFVQRALLNGEPIERSYLLHEEILRGGELVLELGRDASPSWGRPPEQRPRSRVKGDRVLTAPWVESEGATFRGRTSILLRSADTSAELRYVLGSEGDPAEGTLATGPIELASTTQLRFIALAGARRSPEMQATFYKIPDQLVVSVASTPNPQYTAGGHDALIDGRRGPEDWRTGAWQGYQAQDFVATLDLGAEEWIEYVAAGFLQDMRSWIWMPTEVHFAASLDAERWRDLGSVRHTVPDDVDQVFREDLGVPGDGRRARFLRVHAVNYGQIPAWHPGAGGEAFIFIDEILARTAN